MSGVLAIVGRPNVGKSALFNRIAGKRIAIVHDQPGVTRDRITAEVEWHGRPFTLIDTGGIGLRRGEKVVDVILQAALEQVELAIEAASAILFVVNVQEGLVPLDEEVSARLRQSGKPVLLVVNKSDNESFASEAVDFAALGFDRTYPVSAIHGRGLDVLMRAATGFLPDEEAERAAEEGAAGDGGGGEPGVGGDGEGEGEAGAEEPVTQMGKSRRDFNKDPLRLAIVGRPNVGKSSLINALTQSHRVVVSPIPGTTRDAVDVPFQVETEGRREKYVLVDTAGVRKKKSIDSSVEFFSVKRTEDAVGRCDIVILMLDAADGIMEQDKKIGALITEARRACIVVVNKWDLMEETVRAAREVEMKRREKSARLPGNNIPMTTLGEFGQWVQEKLFFLDYAPVIFTSAKSGFHLDRLLEAVRYVAAQLKQAIPTAVLNRTLHDAVVRRQPVSSSGHVLKFYYATQIGYAPPRFVLFLNRSDILNRAYEKYLADCIRTAFGYEGCPVVLIPRARPKTIEPVRRIQERSKARRAKPQGHGVRPGPGTATRASRRDGPPARKPSGPGGVQPGVRPEGRSGGPGGRLVEAPGIGKGALKTVGRPEARPEGRGRPERRPGKKPGVRSGGRAGGRTGGRGSGRR